MKHLQDKIQNLLMDATKEIGEVMTFFLNHFHQFIVLPFKNQ